MTRAPSRSAPRHSFGRTGCRPQRPGIAEPERRQQIERRRLRAAIPGRDPHQNVFRRGLRVFHEHIEIAVPIEDARIDQLEFRVRLGPPAILLDQPV